MRMSINPFRARKQHEEAELNLIPMIDIMSVMVAFLLMYSTEVEVVPNSKSVVVPDSTANVKPTENVVVMITRDGQIFVQNELIADAAQVADKNQPFVNGLYNYLTQTPDGMDSAAQAAALAKKEITVLADQNLPYEVIRKVMTTCTKANYGKLSLAVLEKGGDAKQGG